MKQTEPTREIVLRAWNAGTVVPAFNIPYLPMLAPVVRALSDTRRSSKRRKFEVRSSKFEEPRNP